MVGHDVAIVCVDDFTEQEVAYGAEDWRDTTSPSWVLDHLGLHNVLADGRLSCSTVPYREARCPSERARFMRIAAKAGIRSERS